MAQDGCVRGLDFEDRRAPQIAPDTPSRPLAASGGSIGLHVADMNVHQLLRIDGRGGRTHEVGGRGGLGERDHVANGVQAAGQRGDPVQAESKSPVGRSPVFECTEKEAELVGLLLRANSCLLYTSPSPRDS